MSKRAEIHKAVLAYILSSVNTVDYSGSFETNISKIKFIHERLMNEAFTTTNFEYFNGNKYKIVCNWLQGLPSSLKIEFTTLGISEILESWGLTGAGKLVVKIRYDQRGNSHNSFAITGTIYRDHREWGAGCFHDDIRQFAPELAHLIKWHGMTSEGPLHYIANTMYHASDRDCNGLRKGERKQIISGRTGFPCWQLQTLIDGQCRDVRIDGYKCQIDCKADDLPVAPEGMFWGKWCRVGEGKEPDLKAARSCAIWDDATIDQLRDREALEARLPTLIDEFSAVVESLGFTF